MKENERKKKENELAKEKECEQEKKIEIRSKNESSKERIEKEREFEPEIEKEMIEKDEREQEKVSKGLCDKLQLHYLPNERRFRLLEKGKTENDIYPPLLKGKQDKFERDVCRIDVWHLVKKMTLVQADFKLIPPLSFLPTLKIYFDKVRPIYTLKFGNGLLALVWTKDLARVCYYEPFYPIRQPRAL
ncbi:hypothetical protein PVK06_035078 [Gossypium arboreum]|uniref:Uncharacterized protein n=1 Tax=Gossypium arboreum TaxID=29729 RepID=A0ABR0NGG4_GOSAR|nr:hypothetical protein PVK06_035078 [Gossypium arboreum]